LTLPSPYVLVSFVTALPAATVPPNHPGRLLGLVRTLIDYGRQLASTLQQRTAATNLTEFTRNFGTIDIAQILACITRGLHRAAALEARLVGRLARAPAAPVAVRAPSLRQPRAARPTGRSTGTADPRIARLPTPSEIAAQVRRRPVGAVIADICRDLGIVPAHPLWHEISIAIIANNGSLAALFVDACRRIVAVPAIVPPLAPTPYPPSVAARGTGPP
jgi:hypothetical protein